MSTATDPRPPENDFQLPEDSFQERYNARSEFPLATVLSVLLHVVVGVIIVYGFFRLMNKSEDRSSVPTRIIDVIGGDDDSGEGMAGSGGNNAQLAQENLNPLQAFKEALPNPQALPEIKDTLRRDISVMDPTADPLPITDENAAAYALAQKSLRDKLLGGGGKPGTGPNAGSGDTGANGTGSGRGGDDTQARSFRWTLRFRTSSGRNYLDQVKSLGAVIAVPMPPNEDKLLVIEDLDNPSRRHIADDAETAKLAGWLKFSDVRRETVRQVGEALNLEFTPTSFWAFFPKELEEGLARKERSYRNRRPDDIEETVFQVTIRAGGYDILVVEQRAK